jgi:cbb3-type cytochrome oxidase subunit 3
VNTVLQAAKESVSMGWLLGLMTVVFFVFFVAWVWWAWHPANEELMEKAARMPFADGGEG